MDPHRRPAPRDALSDERAREEALAAVLRLEEKKQETQRWDPPRQTTRRRVATAAVLFVAALWAWFGPLPTFGGPDAEFVALQDARVAANLELAVALHAERIRAFRLREGRLPDRLAETGEPLSGIHYTRIDAGSYRLQARQGGHVVNFVSSDSLTVRLRSALDVLRETGADEEEE